MAITALPTPPSTNDPANFATRADAFMAALPVFVDELNAYGGGLAGAVSGTSTTSVAVAAGSKSFTTQTNLGFQIGQFVLLASAAGPTNFMAGQITAYNIATGALVVNVTTTGGSGTTNDWVISLVPIFGAGAYLEAEVPLASPLSLTSTVAKDLTSLSLSAGDWEVWGNVGFLPAGSTVFSNQGGWVSDVSATLPTAPNKGGEIFTATSTVAGGATHLWPIGRRRFSLSVTTTIYLSAYGSFSASTATAYGFIAARKYGG